MGHHVDAMMTLLLLQKITVCQRQNNINQTEGDEWRVMCVFCVNALRSSGANTTDTELKMNIGQCFTATDDAVCVVAPGVRAGMRPAYLNHIYST